MVKVVAHRGVSGIYPENTKIAFLEAIKLKVDMIEFDVHLSKDKELIVIHDDSVDRTSDGSGRVDCLTLPQIKSLNAGALFGDKYEIQRFLTLQEALDILVDSGIRLNIHIKAYDNTRDRVVPLTLAELVRRDLFKQAFVASDEKSIILAKSIQPDLRICNLTTLPLYSYVERSLAAQCYILQPDNNQVDKALVAKAHEHGMEVNPFFADDEAEMLGLIDCGVDGILSNRPDILQGLLKRLDMHG